jgi:hypothetical protein
VISEAAMSINLNNCPVSAIAEDFNSEVAIQILPCKFAKSSVAFLSHINFVLR